MFQSRNYQKTVTKVKMIEKKKKKKKKKKVKMLLF